MPLRGIRSASESGRMSRSRMVRSDRRHRIGRSPMMPSSFRSTAGFAGFGMSSSLRRHGGYSVSRISFCSRSICGQVDKQRGGLLKPPAIKGVSGMLGAIACTPDKRFGFKAFPGSVTVTITGGSANSYNRFAAIAREAEASPPKLRQRGNTVRAAARRSWSVKKMDVRTWGKWRACSGRRGRCLLT